ncbi:MAG: DUF975 family protein [Oscillospiraceae bacterium]|nr:DUF975 family protein [Oscillospiraceae bacterium]
MFCSKCGVQNNDGSLFCSDCGSSLGGGEAKQTRNITQSLEKTGMVGDVVSKSARFLLKKPLLLWGLSLLYSILAMLASFMFLGIPGLGIAVTLVLSLGMTSIYLKGYRGKQVSSAQLFEGFSSKFFRNAGGMAWMSLWVFIWGLIPFAGFVFAVIKSYSYRFVPYIMLGEPDIPATEALKKSMVQTNGHKGKMFLVDFIICLAVGLTALILFLLSLIPVAGIIFMVVLIIFAIAAALLLPLFLGIISAAFYDEITKRNPEDA